MTMHLTSYLTLLAGAESTLAASYRAVAAGPMADSDVHYTCHSFARQCDTHSASLAPVLERYASHSEPEPDRLHPPGLTGHRAGAVGLLRDLQDLYQLATLVTSTWTLTSQAAQAARDQDLIDVVSDAGHQTTAQLAWLRMRMKADAPQTLLVAP
jgi:hypothetical protein